MDLKIGLPILLVFGVSIISFATTTKEISFKNRDVTLQGTLYYPKGEGPFPAVVFVHGSGPETRDNSKYSAKWMASIGYVALTYDKRGTGESDGDENDWKRFSFEHLAGDIMAAVDILATDPKVKAAKIGIHAASQGGWVSVLAAAKSEKINFMIIKSASVTTVHEDRVFERTQRLKKEEFSDDELAQAKTIQNVEAKTSEEDLFPDLFEKYKDTPWIKRVYGDLEPSHPSLIAYREWYSTIAYFDPITYLKQIDIPIMWIFGDPKLDNHGPVKKSIENLESLIASKNYEIRSYSDQDHNVKEKEYEADLYQWLIKINGDNGFKFRKH
ncbi:alpha/beta hydrolase family protein [Ekhidna sp.]|uniref:alpha/beta hydrolase family protein n=1 Tax=Ekhidna sp. TaxID=2608089 RepID=UPI003BAC1453